MSDLISLDPKERFVISFSVSPPTCSPARNFRSDSDDETFQKNIHSDMSLTELNQSLRMGLPRPLSGEFRKLFEGNSP